MIEEKWDLIELMLLVGCCFFFSFVSVFCRIRTPFYFVMLMEKCFIIFLFFTLYCDRYFSVASNPS
jgi:hypothetical protein